MFDVNIFETGDELLVQITGVIGNFKATVVGLRKPRLPEIKISEKEETRWKNVILKDGDYIVLKIFTLEKCIFCKTETPYSKDTHIDERLNYKEGHGQLCAECAKKMD